MAVMFSSEEEDNNGQELDRENGDDSEDERL